MIKVIQMGLGPIGQRLTQYLRERDGLEIVGAVDPDPNKAGQDAGKLGGGDELGITIKDSLSEALKHTDADVAVISTVSSLAKMEPQIEDAAAQGLHMVSTCEELIHPFHIQPKLAKRLDALCKKHRVACLGTGVNPGFLMDYLPAVLSSVCRKVDYVNVERYQDARPRRVPFQQKIGAGLSESEFREKEDSLRHIGLPESVYLLAAAFGWQLDEVEEVLTPVLAEEDIELDWMTIGKGKMTGVRQVATGYVDGKEVISLDFKAAIDLNRSYDKVEIKGEPGFSSLIEGGVNGDIATSAIVVNAVRSIVRSEAGLKTMLDIPVPSYYGGM